MGKHMKSTVKSVLSIMLSFIMLIGLLQISTVTAKAAGNVVDIFNDVQAGQWYVEAVQFVYDRGIMVGTNANTFGVSQKLQREQFAQILYSMAGKPAVAANAENPFKDVKNNPGYPRDAILWAYSKGIVAGNADGTFGVGQAIQRQAIAVMLYKYSKEFGYDLTAKDNAIDGYADKSKVESWAVPAIKWAVTQGIISGKSGNKLDPAGNGTRAECAQMIMKLMMKNSGLPKVGEIIKFGKYEQDDDVSNGREDIEWQVLDVDTGKKRVFVVSKYAIDAQPYNYEDAEVTWETCSLRNWLNVSFYNSAFSSDERKRIPTVTIKNKNLDGLEDCKDTKDRVFLLSMEETEKYFGEYQLYMPEYMFGLNQNLLCTPTKYTLNKSEVSCNITEEYYNTGALWNPATSQYDIKVKDVYTKDIIGQKTTWWYLRTQASKKTNACFVNMMGGSAGMYRVVVRDERFGVRPAMWIQY